MTARAHEALIAAGVILVAVVGLVCHAASCSWSAAAVRSSASPSRSCSCSPSSPCYGSGRAISGALEINRPSDVYVGAGGLHDTLCSSRWIDDARLCGLGGLRWRRGRGRAWKAARRERPTRYRSDCGQGQSRPDAGRARSDILTGAWSTTRARTRWTMKSRARPRSRISAKAVWSPPGMTRALQGAAITLTPSATAGQTTTGCPGPISGHFPTRWLRAGTGTVSIRSSPMIRSTISSTSQLRRSLNHAWRFTNRAIAQRPLQKFYTLLLRLIIQTGSGRRSPSTSPRATARATSIFAGRNTEAVFRKSPSGDR